jgi:DNA invertase Pin-like site-specific DNA recombinase
MDGVEVLSLAKAAGYTGGIVQPSSNAVAELVDCGAPGVIYIRQSERADPKKTVSPQTQLHNTITLALTNHLSDVLVVQDLGKTGGNTRRSAFQVMVGVISAWPKDRTLHILMNDQERSFRNAYDALTFRGLLEDRPWVHWKLHDGEISAAPAGRFTYTIMAAAAEYVRDTAAQKIREAKAFRSARGLAVGPVPFGYLWKGDANEPKEVVIDKANAAVVQSIFREYSEGHISTITLAHRLNVEGKASPTNRGWSGDSLAQMLGNPFYAGQTYSISRRHRAGELIDGTWTGIVDRELFRRVQLVLKRNMRQGGRRTGKPNRVYTFQGLLICSCGRRLQSVVRPRSGREERLYRCNRSSPGPLCNEPMIHEGDLLPWAEFLFTNLDNFRNDVFRRGLEGGTSVPYEEVGESIASVDRVIERLKTQFRLQHIDEPEYVAEFERLQNVRAELLNKAPEIPIIKLEGLAQAWGTGDPQTQHDLLSALFATLYVVNGRIIEYRPKEGREAAVSKLIAEALPLGVGSGSASLPLRHSRFRHTYRVDGNFDLVVGTASDRDA